MARDLGGDQGVGVRNKTAQQAEQRSSRNCQIFCAIPISIITMAIPRAERSSMIFLPCDQQAPQNGEAMAEKRKVILKTSPDHVQGAMPGDAELFDVEWQKGHDQLKAAPVKSSQASHGQVSFPVNGVSADDIGFHCAAVKLRENMSLLIMRLRNRCRNGGEL